MRIMSESVRHILREGEKIAIPENEIITLTGIEHMTVKLIMKSS